MINKVAFNGMGVKRGGRRRKNAYGHPKSNSRTGVSSCMMTPIKMISLLYGLYDHYHSEYQSNRNECFPCYNFEHK